MTIDLVYWRNRLAAQEHSGSPHVGLTAAQFAEILDELEAGLADVGRLAKAREKLAERLRQMADYDHRDLATHRPYSLEECPFVGCRENAYALRLGKPRRLKARR